jgi:HK97 family phage major capsid protein
MSKLNELRQKRGVAITAARSILDKVDAEKRELTSEESTEYDSYLSEQELLATNISREERQEKLDSELAEQASRQISILETNNVQNEPDEMRSFSKALAFGFSGLSGQEQRALKMGADDAGGYLVPPVEWLNQLIKKVDDLVFIRGLATKFTVANAQSLGVPSLENDPADSDWTSELAIGSEDSTMDFGSRSLSPHPLAKLLKVSEKLLRASGDAGGIVMDRLAYKLSITEEKGFLTGSGANQPLGIFTASANGISTSRDVSTGNTTTAISADGLIEAKYSLKGAYHAAAQWVFHRDAIKTIAKLKDGDGQYIWKPGLVLNDPDRLLGFPLNMSEYAPNTFTTGLYVGMLGDFSNYWVVDALGARIQRLNELYAAAAQVGFISRSETDGMPVLEESFARVTLA